MSFRSVAETRPSHKLLAPQHPATLGQRLTKPCVCELPPQADSAYRDEQHARRKPHHWCYGHLACRVETGPKPRRYGTPTDDDTRGHGHVGALRHRVPTGYPGLSCRYR